MITRLFKDVIAEFCGMMVKIESAAKIYGFFRRKSKPYVPMIAAYATLN